MPNTIITQPAVPGLTLPAGHYADQTDLFSIVGDSQIVEYSNFGDEGQMLGNQQRAIDYAEADIDRRFRQAGVTTPVPATHPNFPVIKDAAATLAVCKLYRSRGVTDGNKKLAGKMADARQQADAVINNLCVPGRMDAGPADPTETFVPTTL